MQFDQGSSALIQDLKQRGLLEDTLVVWGGKFGRTVYMQGNPDAYGRRGGEPGELTVGTALTEIVPLHSLMGEKIEKLRHWAQGRTRNASHRDRPHNGRRKLDL